MRKDLIMDRGWLFYFGEPDMEWPKFGVPDQTYRASRAENGRGPARREYDDKAWEKITLPHDFVTQEETRYPPVERIHPKDRGSAWYRRHFRLEPEWKDKRILLMFDAVGVKSQVYVNSMPMFRSETGAVPFVIDITPVARYGADRNVVSVHCDCHEFEAWYYEPGGIYRDVHLIITDNLAVDTWGTFVRTAPADGKNWSAQVETEVYSNFYEPRRGRVISLLLGPDGTERARMESETVFEPQRVTKICQETLLADPELWSPDDCRLWELRTLIRRDGETVDEVHTTFGLREVTFDPDTGMYINGKHVKLFGFMSQDAWVGLGAAVSDAVVEYKMKTLKECGSNGFRTMHQAHHPATTYWADRTGQLVMDENRIFHASQESIDALRRMVKRDRNSPSVLFWSVYNEEDLIGTEEGKSIFRKLKAAVNELDPTRPVSGASSFGQRIPGAHEYHDLLGVNHQSMYYEETHACNPDKPIYGSESGGFTARKGGLFTFVGANGTCAAWDHIAREYCVGAYVIDSIISMSGWRNEGWHLTRAGLKPDDPYGFISIREGGEFEFPDTAKGPRQIVVCNNGDHVCLYQNGEKLGESDSNIFEQPVFEADIDAGDLRAVITKNGEPWAEAVYEMPGAPTAVRLELLNRSPVKADGRDLAIVNAYAVDEKGRICDRLTGPVFRFQCSDAGEYVSGGTTGGRHVQEQGNPGGWMPPEIDILNGRCQTFWRSLDRAGKLIVTCTCEGLKPAVLEIDREMTGHYPSVPETDSLYVTDWRLSPVMVNIGSKQQIMAEARPETWEKVNLLGVSGAFDGLKTQMTPFGLMPGKYSQDDILWTVYHARTTVPETGVESGKLTLLFEGFDGIGEVFVSGEGKSAHGVMTENSPWPGHFRPELHVDCSRFKAGDTVDIWGFISDSNRCSSISWPVRWTVE